MNGAISSSVHNKLRNTTRKRFGTSFIFIIAMSLFADDTLFLVAGNNGENAVTKLNREKDCMTGAVSVSQS